MKRAIVCALVFMLGGCSSSHVHVAAGSASHGVSFHADGGTALAVLLGAAFFASAYERDILLGEGTRALPDLAPDRRVSEQDCTKPIDWSLGNIRCK